MKTKMILWCLVLCLLLSACGPKQTQTPAEPPAQQVPSQPTEVPTESPAEQPVEEVPAPRLTESGQLLEGTLWNIPHEEIAGGLQQQMCLYGDALLVWGSGWKEDAAVFRLTAYSLSTGEILHRTDLSGLEIPQVQVCGDLAAVTDWGSGTVLLLDETLQETETLQADVTYGGIYLSPDAGTVFSITREDGIVVTDRQTGRRTVLLEEAEGLLAAGRSGQWVTVTYTDPRTQLTQSRVLDLETARLAEVPFSGSCSQISRRGDLWLAQVLGEDHTWYTGRAERPHRFRIEGRFVGAALIDGNGRILITEHDPAGGTVLRLYGADGQFLSRCALPAGSVQASDLVWSEADGGYFLLVTAESGQDLLLFWDTAAVMPGENLQMQSAYEPPAEGAVVAAELYQQAAVLSERFGLQICIAELAQTSFRDFSALPEMGEAYIRAALDTVEQTLALYPDGFFPQLRYAMQQRIELHLVGTVTRTEQQETAAGFTSFSGFMEQGEGGNIIAVDISGSNSLQMTLCHEIAHLIDSKLEFDANRRETAVYSQEAWNSLNPQGFSYAERYVDLPMSLYHDGYDSWFVDLYSRTYAKEDRARILEYATVGTEQVFVRAPGCREKLEYLCACIRDSFDTENWPDVTVWERTLRQVS